MFNLSKVEKEKPETLLEGLNDSDTEEREEEQAIRMSVLEHQSNFSFFDSLVDKALLGEF